MLVGFNCSKAAKYSGRLLSDPIPAEPNRTYQLSAFVKMGAHSGDRPWIWVIQVNEAGEEIKHLPTGVQLNSEEWQQYTCTFVADTQASQFYIYAGAMPGRSPNNIGLSFWIDDVALISLDYALANVIRTTITDVDVRDAKTNVAYKLGTDFAVRNSTGGEDPMQVTMDGNFRSGPNSTSLTSSLLSFVHVLPGGNINVGQELVLDYDFQPGAMGHHDYDLWEGLSDHLPWRK